MKPYRDLHPQAIPLMFDTFASKFEYCVQLNLVTYRIYDSSRVMRSNSKRILYCQSWPLSPLCTSTPNTKSTHPNSDQASVPRCPRSAGVSILLAGPGIPEASTLKSIPGNTGHFPFSLQNRSDGQGRRQLRKPALSQSGTAAEELV